MGGDIDSITRINTKITLLSYYMEFPRGRLDKVEAEVKIFLIGLRYCKENGKDFMILEIDFLALQKCVLR